MPIFSPLHSGPIPGLQAVEAISYFQIPSFTIVGLPAPEVGEARERVRSAILQSGFEFPKRKLVLNLSPASIRKRGTGLDLPIALAVLAERAEPPLSGKIAAWGELGLDGLLKPGGLPARSLYAAWKGGVETLILSNEEVSEAMRWLSFFQESKTLSSPPPKLIGVDRLSDAWAIARGEPVTTSTQASIPLESQASVSHGSHGRQPVPLPPPTPTLRRVLEASAAGCHHVLLLGRKGAGKTHAIEWLCSLHEPWSASHQVEQALLSELFFASGSANAQSIRRVGTQVRPQALIGQACGDGTIRPGEFSLAHGGILIADELLEWARDSREAMREPLESGGITLTRQGARATLPARFTLAATSNCCPCGGSASARLNPEIEDPSCICLPQSRARYLTKLSGPILDRVDLSVMVAGTAKASGEKACIAIEHARTRVHKAREILKRSLHVAPAWLEPAALEDWLSDHSAARASLEELQAKNLRSRHKMLRVALTLSALDGLEAPTEAHWHEASAYRIEIGRN